MSVATIERHQVRVLTGVIVVFSVSAVITLATLVTIALFARPVADDFPAFSTIREIGWSVVGYDYSTFSGRFTNNVLYAVPYVLFGDRALWIVPIAILSTLVASLAFIGSRVNRDSRLATATGAVLGGSAGLAVVIVQPSLFDTFAWYTSSTLYLASVAVLALSAALIVAYRGAEGRFRVAILVGIGFSFFVMQGLSETIAAPVLGVVILAGVAVFTFARRVLREWRTPIVIAMCASLPGLLLSALAPGRAGRVSIQTLGEPIGIPAILRSAVADIPHFLHYFAGPIVLIVIAVGIGFGLVLPAMSVRTRVIVSGLSVLTSVAAVISTSALVHYGYNGGAVPFRAWAFPTAVFVVSLVALIAVAIAGFTWWHAATVGVAGAVIVAALAGYGIGWKSLSSETVGAVVLRAQLIDARAADIGEQLKAGATTIEIMPAPVLLEATESADYNLPGSSGPDWTDDNVAEYHGVFGLPTIPTAQQPTYCRSGFSNPYWAIRSCEELAQDRHGTR